MKHKLRFGTAGLRRRRTDGFLDFLFRPSGLIISFLLLFSTSAIAQESTPQEFHIGAKPGRFPQQEDSTMNSYFECGFNGIWWEAYPYVKDWLDSTNLELLAENGHSREDFVYHYATGYYSKWEAEVDAEAGRVGLKHRDSLGFLIGSYSTWQDTVSCWSSIGLTGPRDSLIYGPHYRQEKRYKRWYEEQGYDKFNLKYNVRFKMALAKSSGVPDNDDICKIKVVYRYNKQYEDGSWDPPGDTLFLQKILKVQDFPDGGEFDYFYFDSTYSYPAKFRPPEIAETDYMYKLDIEQSESVIYNDSEAGEGIQFWVEWLRTDNLCTLYVDNIEVYDNDGWNNYIEHPEEVAGLISHYADSVTNEYSYLKYFYAHDEPYTIDAFVPYHTVEQIVMSETGIPLITEFYPYWTWDDSKINGEDFLQQWYDIGQPEKLMIDFYPFSPDYPFRFTDAEELRKRLQKCSELQPGFWYSAQGAGYKDTENNWVIWRMPDSSEFKATVMLALAHGSTGIELFSYTSFRNNPENYTYGIVENRTDSPFVRRDLWYHLKDGLIPRLKGKLGKTVMNLNYTGNYLQLQRDENQQSPPPPVNFDYLTLRSGSPEQLILNWHCGFFGRPSYPEDKYFMLANLITTYDDRHIEVTLQPPVPNYENYRFRNIEGIFDTTFNDGITKLITHIKGEGYLYEVAPVVLFGGRLLFDEYAGEDQILSDDMVIENGKTLSISGTYFADGNIIIKNGSIVNYENGRIQFGNGKKLIIEGNAIISGTDGAKLVLDFVSPEYENGIVVKPGASLTMSYCEIQNAVKGITSELNLYNLDVQNVNFVDCDSVAVYIIGRNGAMDEITLTPPPPKIKNCTISNSIKGISAANLSQIVIQQNTFTGNDISICLSNVTTPAVINNSLTGNNQMPGIFLESCNGVVRGNFITGHTNGIHLGNSSPDIGGNNIEHNWNHGIYSGSGSLPNLIGRLVQDPICCVWYAVSGYNTINVNGGWELYDDGSEIFINNANVLLGDGKRDGCNEITDQRVPNTEDTPPLYNTQLLINSFSSGYMINTHAEGNFWEVHPIYELSERFGGNVYYRPFKDEPCPRPDRDDGKLFIKSSSGEIIDTLYAEERDPGTLSETELLYAQAEEKFITADYEGAELIFNQIVNSGDSVSIKLDAYRRLYEIGKFEGKDETFFAGLRESFLSFAGSTDDSLLAKIFVQLSTLSLVTNQEYIPAINEFDNIIQQNPNTEEAVYAEIDAFTAALLIEGDDSTFQKGRLGKYLVKSSGDYNSKIDNLLRKHFGRNVKESEEKLLPTEYTLYQNYPNPFNPNTKIKYDLPNASEVSLIIYDILGRKVKELVNSKQQAGRYEVQFDASNLSSGVYIYQLIADKFISSQKMILIK